MAWNRPSEDKAKVRGEGEQRNVHLKGLLAGVIVVLGAAFAAWWLWPTVESAGETLPPQAKPTRIKEVTPASAPKKAATEPVKQLSEREKEIKWFHDRYGTNIPENLKWTYHYLVHPPQQTFTIKGRNKFLRHQSERQIAAVGLAQPGTVFAIRPEFGEIFDESFTASLDEKIEILPDDTEEVKAVKQGVIALKKEIVEICKNEGKKPSDVMNEHAKAMYDLGQFKQQLEQETDRLHVDRKYTDADIEDFVKAANKMLTDKGLPEMEHPDFTKRAMLIKIAERTSQREETEGEPEK